ncbi:MAG: response regulator [Flavobacteriaceae bacterium]|nr:response regulator [Flavobacteriaceae bacterium]
MIKKFLILAVCLGMVGEAVQGQSSQHTRNNLSSLLQKAEEEFQSHNFQNAIETHTALIDLALAAEENYYAYRAYTAIGTIYREVLKDSAKARTHYENALEQALLTESDSLLAGAYSSMGDLYSEYNNTHKKAIEFYEKSIEINKKSGFDDIKNISAYTKIGNAYLALEQPSEAAPYLLKAKSLLKGEEQPLTVRLEIRFLMGKYYMQIDKYALAKKELKEVAALAETHDLIILGAATHKYLAIVNEMRGDYKEANANLRKEALFNDRIYSLERVDEMQEAGAKYELAQFQRELDLAEDSKAYSEELVATTNLLNVIFVSAFVISLIVLAGFVFLLLSRKKYVDRLSEKNKQLTKAKNEAEKLSKLKSQFFSTVSHEIRTPLYGVIGLSSILLEEEKLGKHQEDLVSLKFSADYLLALINDVLLMNKMDADGVTLEQNPFRLSKLIKNVTQSFAFSLEQNDNKMHVEIDEDIPDYLIGDSIRISQILMNLVGNAVKFNEHGNIWLQIKLYDQPEKDLYDITFVVKDDGIGIPKDKQKIIFEVFSQVEIRNYEYQGTGLGLPIVKKLLSLHGSEIHLESELGDGATFSFQLELQANPAMHLKTDVSKIEDIKLENTAFEDIHILVVDDNKINQKVTQKILESRNFRCSLADGGNQAVQLAKEHSYQLILMDIHMPDKDGIQTTREIREFDMTTPIVALTAVEADEIRTVIYQAGMDDLILKPYDVSQFLNTILRNLKHIHASAI